MSAAMVMLVDQILSPTFWLQFWQDAITTATSRGLRALMVVGFYVVARFVVHRTVNATLEHIVRRHGEDVTDSANRVRTLQSLVNSVASYALFFIFLIMFLDAVGVNITGIVTTAGVGGLAIGFGAQKLVRDMISGFIIMVENQFAVGDYVTVGAATGTVEELGMRTTRVRDDQGRLWILSNGDISVVANHSRAPASNFIELGIAAGADVERAAALVAQAGEALFVEAPGGLREAPRPLGISGYDAARTTLRVSVVCDPAELTTEQMRVREAARRALVAGNIALA